jgi:hypothetical protein
MTTANATTLTIKPAVTYTVYYRTGGTDNFKWLKVNERYEDMEKAQGCVNHLRRAGYKAQYEVTSKLEAIGLPETFE